MNRIQQLAHNPNTLFAISLFAILTMLFFRLDELIGWITIRAFYPDAGIFAGLLLFVMLVALLYGWDVLTYVMAIGALLLCAIDLLFLRASLLFSFNLMPLFVYLCAPQLVIILLIGLVLFRLTGLKKVPQWLLRLITVWLLLAGVVHAVGIGSVYTVFEYTFPVSAEWGDQHYIAAHVDTIGDEQIILYECDQRGFFCEPIYESPRERKYDADGLRLETDSGSIRLFMGNELLYTGQE